MGEFLGVSAFRDRSVDDVVRTIQSYMASHGVACEVVTSGSTEEALDALVFAPNDGWI